MTIIMLMPVLIPVAAPAPPRSLQYLGQSSEHSRRGDTGMMLTSEITTHTHPTHHPQTPPSHPPTHPAVSHYITETKVRLLLLSLSLFSSLASHPHLPLALSLPHSLPLFHSVPLSLSHPLPLFITLDRSTWFHVAQKSFVLSRLS